MISHDGRNMIAVCSITLFTGGGGVWYGVYIGVNGKTLFYVTLRLEKVICS